MISVCFPGPAGEPENTLWPRSSPYRHVVANKCPQIAPATIFRSKKLVQSLLADTQCTRALLPAQLPADGWNRERRKIRERVASDSALADQAGFCFRAFCVFRGCQIPAADDPEIRDFLKFPRALGYNKRMKGTQSPKAQTHRRQARILAMFITLSVAAASHAQDDGLPTTVQLPTFGVSVDSNGVLSTVEIANDHQSIELGAARRRRVNRGEVRDIDRPSRCRKISLRRLTAALKSLAGDTTDSAEDDFVDDSESRPDEILHLAGLASIEYVFVHPDESDIVIAGPAAGWVEDRGRQVNVENGRPALLLKDLTTALNATTGSPGEWFGCSIDPTKQSLKNLAELNRKIPSSIPQTERLSIASQLDEGIRQALGNADVRVFGIPADSRMAMILVEADYRMKRMALGVERLPISMKSYADLIRSPPRDALQRWWMTPDVDKVQSSKDGLNWRLMGSTVKLQTENYAITNGVLSREKQPTSRASQLFAKAFTVKYPQIAQASPVFADLENMMNLLLVAALVKNQDLTARAELDVGELTKWSALAVGDVERVAPRLAPCVVNVFWRGSRLLAPAGGGVTIKPGDYLNGKNVKLVDDQSLENSRTGDMNKNRRWWWD